MAITFYYGSGSPYAWRVWLALERKKLPYELVVLSFSAGDTEKPEFVAINPRHQVPAIVDDGFALYESSAIVEYLEDRYAGSGDPLWPRDPRSRAIARRLSVETDLYLSPANRKLLRLTLFRAAEPADPKDIAEARAALDVEIARVESTLERPFVAGDEVSAADFAIYPVLALTRRIAKRKPEHEVTLPPRTRAWMERIESLPYFDKTIPPHWKE